MHRTPMYQEVELNEAALQILVSRGHRLRAEAFHAALGALGRRIAGLARALGLGALGLGALGSGALAAAARYRAWRQRRVAVAELLALDDRTLRDIGLSRGDVARLVRQLRRGVPVERAAVRAELVRLPRPRGEIPPGKLAA